MAFVQHDTGVRTFGNPVSTIADAERAYTATLQQTPREVRVFAQRPDGSPAVQVAALPVSAEAQSISLFGFGGQLYVTVLSLDVADQSRVFKHFPLGVAVAAPVPTPPPPAGGDNATVKAQLHALVDQIR